MVAAVVHVGRLWAALAPDADAPDADAPTVYPIYPTEIHRLRALLDSKVLRRTRVLDA